MIPIEIIVILACAVTIIMLVIVLVLMRKYRDEQQIIELARHDIVLSMARVTLLENYRLCEAKGFYSIEDREVYGKLYKSYKSFGGDDIIDEMGVKLRELPTQYESE